MNYIRDDLRDQLAHVGLDVVRSRLVVGSGGNLSARLPAGDSCWVTASGTWLDRLDRLSFVEVGIADGAVRPDGRTPPPAPSSELALHLATYRARPDVQAIVHLHPQSVLLIDLLDEPIRLVTTDHAFYLRRIAQVPFALPGSVELAELAADAATDGTNCLVLRHHGCSVLGESVELAHKRALNLEEAAQLSYRALLAGRLDTLPGCPPAFLERIARGTATA